MIAAVKASLANLAAEVNDLFYQRTRISLWLGIVFFSFFSLLDFFYCRPYFMLFFFYRMSLIAVLLCILQLLKHPEAQRYTRALMFVAMLLGTLTISLMTVKQGGYVSGYYVGILLMIAGGFSVLPLNVFQALLLGGSMYLVYALTVYIGSRPLDDQAVIYVVNNSFFFLSVVLVTTVQCFDEIQTQLKSLRAKNSLRVMNSELKHYTDNLEALIKQRMALQEESELKFRDLYNNILDLVVLIEQTGTIQMVNQHGAALLELTPEALQKKPLTDFIVPKDRDSIYVEVIRRLQCDEEVRGIQLQMLNCSGRIIDVELSGTRVDMLNKAVHYQLIIRDITSTKEMKRRVLASNQLIDSSRQAAIFGLARLAECRDVGTGAHLLRIRAYTRILATELAEDPSLQHLVTDDFIEDLCLSSLLHDIGKVGISDSILLKPERLTESEFEDMKRHCEFGSIALSSAEKDSESHSFLRMGQDITRFHHEQWDGSGYPDGLSGIDIPLAARIVALADVYDALTSSRSYKPAYTHKQARTYIVRESGHRFDPTIVNAFLSREREFKAARKHLLLQANVREY